MNTSSTRSRRALLAAALSVPAVIAPIAVAAPASAHRPARPCPPVVTVEPTWRFQVGAQVDRTAPAQEYFGDLRVFHQRIPVRLKWHGRACGHARIAGYDLYRHNPIHAGELNPVLIGTKATSYDFLHLDVAYPEVGPIGPSLHPRFRLVATDTAGRTTTVDPIRRHPEFSEQEDGTTYQNGRDVFPRAPRAGHGWYQRTGPDYDAGKVLTTNRRGAAVRIPVNAHEGGQWIAFEMTTGPRLGAVEVRVDGHRVGTVDTYSTRTRPRVLVAEYRLTEGRHTVTLVNLGTRHRPTVELDGVFASDYRQDG